MEIKYTMFGLKKEGNDYIVKVDGEVYKKTANELFAVQTFNAI